MSGSLPWMKFEVAAWFAEPGLRLCSLAARGLWIDLIGHMHRSGEPYGHLCLDGLPIADDDIAALVGRPGAEVLAALTELEKRRVFSRTEAGIIYSRRMVRDKAKAESDAANGRNGGNPKLKRRVKAKKENGVKGGVKPPADPPPLGEVSETPFKQTQTQTQTQTQRKNKKKKEESSSSDRSLVSQDAFAIVKRIAEQAGYSDSLATPLWLTDAPYTVQKFLNDGAIGEIIEHAVRTAMSRKRDGPPHSFKYFEPCIAKAMAEYESPLPQIIINPLKTEIVNGHRQKIGFVDRARARIAAIEAEED